jgi:hypothetical protein
MGDLTGIITGLRRTVRRAALDYSEEWYDVDQV